MHYLKGFSLKQLENQQHSQYCLLLNTIFNKLKIEKTALRLVS